MKHLPVINFDNLSVKFEVEQIPMAAACNETNSIYTWIIATKKTQSTI